MSFSFRKGKPAGIVKGGKMNNKIIYINPPVHDNEDSSDSDEEMPYDYPSLLNHKAFKGMNKRTKMREFDRIYRLMKKRKKPLKKDPLYDEIRRTKKKTSNKEINIYDRGVIYPMPDTTKLANNLYTAGPNGSGKSTAIAQWLKQYHKLYPKNDIYVFKRDSEPDLAFKGIEFIDVDLEEFADDPLELEDLRNSMLVFDDTARIRNEDINSAVKNLMLDALENGRKKHISVCVSNHLLADSTRTKTQLFESDIIVVFPGSSNAQINYVAKNYVGMSNSAIKKMLKLVSRWVLISKSYPQYVMYAKGAYFL